MRKQNTRSIVDFRDVFYTRNYYSSRISYSLVNQKLFVYLYSKNEKNVLLSFEYPLNTNMQFR